MSTTMHLFEQGPVLRALVGAAASSMRAERSTVVPTTPGPWLEATLPPRSRALIADYVRHVGGDASAYRATLPPHLFPQWAFPLAARAIATTPYPLTRVLNAGCAIERFAPLPNDAPLLVRARLESIDVDDKRAMLTTTIETGTAKIPRAMVAQIRAFVPLGARDGKATKAPDKARMLVPNDAKEIAFQRIDRAAGRTFAALTGDVNPIHWSAAYARAAGFRGCILHGFSTFARAYESIVRGVFSGDVDAVATFDVRFKRPLLLPARVGVFVAGVMETSGSVFVGDALGGDVYLEGQFGRRPRG